ncbi:hypothetical protein ACFX2I_030757 [Malus domestica]
MVLRSILYFRVAHFSFVGNGIVVFVPQLLGRMMLEMGIIMSNKTNDVEFWPAEPKTRVDPSTHTRPSFSLEILSGQFRLQRTNTFSLLPLSAFKKTQSFFLSASPPPSFSAFLPLLVNM